MHFKKSILPFIAFGIAHSAHAQSSVTLYGVIDYGLNYVNSAQSASSGSRTGHSLFSMTGSTRQGSRLGFRGQEDLGGGFKAIFTLESGFNVGTGGFEQGGTLFGRQAFVGIVTPYGTVTTGRQYDSIVDFIQPYANNGGIGVYALHGNDIDNVGNTYRLNNSVKYTSPTIAGFTVGGLYSFGGVAGSLGTYSAYSFGASYNVGPVSIAAAYLQANNPNRSYWGNNANSSATASNLGAITGVQTNPVYGGFASAETLKVAAAAFQYTISASSIVGIGYSHIAFNGLGSAASGNLPQTNPRGYAGNTSFNNFFIFERFAFTPAFWLNGSYDYLQGGGINGKPLAKYHTMNLTLDYFLSKRTDVYMQANYQIAFGVDSTNQPAVAQMYLTVPPSNTSRQVVLRLGLRHLF